MDISVVFYGVVTIPDEVVRKYPKLESKDWEDVALALVLAVAGTKLNPDSCLGDILPDDVDDSIEEDLSSLPVGGRWSTVGTLNPKGARNEEMDRRS